jgi:hypothetical protein
MDGLGRDAARIVLTLRGRRLGLRVETSGRTMRFGESAHFACRRDLPTPAEAGASRRRESCLAGRRQDVQVLNLGWYRAATDEKHGNEKENKETPSNGMY